MARAVWQLMAQARLAELRRVTEAQQSLAAAASRPDPVPSVLRQLAQRRGRPGGAVRPGGDGDRGGGAGARGRGAGGADGLGEVVRPARSMPAASASSQSESTSLAGPPRPVEPGATTRPDRPTAAAPTDPGRPAPASATDTVAGSHLAAYALGAGQGFVLGVAAPQRDPR